MPQVASIVQGAGQAAAGIVEGGFHAIGGAQAAGRAGNAQQAAADQAAEMQREAEKKALEASKAGTTQGRADLQPFTAAGASALPNLQSGLTSLQDLVQNPQSQASFIQNNPFFDALANRAKTDLFSNQAAKGKVGSGGTAEALQNSLVLLGSDLLNQNITQRGNVNAQNQNLANMGLNAASGQADLSNTQATRDVGTITGTAQDVGSLRLQSGAAQAGAILGKFAARDQGNQRASQGALQGLTTVTNGFGAGGGGGMMSLCDMRTKEDIVRIGTLDNGLPVYIFTYKGDDQIHMNVMAQDVEKVNPNAIIEHNGLKYVNMEQIWQ